MCLAHFAFFRIFGFLSLGSAMTRAHIGYSMGYNGRILGSSSSNNLHNTT